MTLLGTLAEPGPLCSTLPSTSIMLGIIPPAMMLKLSVKKPKGGSGPKSRSFTGAAHPTAKPAVDSSTTAHKGCHCSHKLSRDLRIGSLLRTPHKRLLTTLPLNNTNN